MEVFNEMVEKEIEIEVKNDEDVKEEDDITSNQMNNIIITIYNSKTK